MNQAILLSQSNDIDFMIHGIIPLEFMGTTVWITTSHACILIVMAIIIGFCAAALGNTETADSHNAVFIINYNALFSLGKSDLRLGKQLLETFGAVSAFKLYFIPL